MHTFVLLDLYEHDISSLIRIVMNLQRQKNEINYNELRVFLKL